MLENQNAREKEVGKQRSSYITLSRTFCCVWVSKSFFFTSTRSTVYSLLWDFIISHFTICVVYVCMHVSPCIPIMYHREKWAHAHERTKKNPNWIFFGMCCEPLSRDDKLFFVWKIVYIFMWFVVWDSRKAKVTAKKLNHCATKHNIHTTHYIIRYVAQSRSTEIKQNEKKKKEK